MKLLYNQYIILQKWGGMKVEAKEVAKKILSIALKKYQENKKKEESTLEWIIISSIAEACLEEYPSYQIIFLEKDEELLKAIKRIVIKINVNDTVHMLKEESINELVDSMAKQNLINVITKSGSESDVDLQSFYINFKKNILRISRQLLEKNDVALKKLLVDANIEEVKNTELILEELKELKKLLKENNQSKNKIRTNLENIKKVMVRNIENGTEKIMEQCESTLDLCKYFNGRMCESEENWIEIKKEIEAFTDGLDCNVKYEMNLSVCYTVAYYLGICLNSKSSREIRIKQSSNGSVDWTPDFSNEIKKYNEFMVEEQKMKEGIGDLAICISVTSDIKGDVVEYLNAKHIEVGKVVNFTLDKKVGNKAVENGNHAWNLAEQVKTWLSKRNIKERNANLHIFIAAPVSIAFFLGQQSFAFSNINLYEYTGIFEPNSIYKKSIFINKGERL